MTITYLTEDQFYTGIYNLVTRGLMFEANAAKLTITLTGGF